MAPGESVVMEKYIEQPTFEGNSIIPAVSATVPVTDDPSISVMTARTLILGVISWFVMAAGNAWLGPQAEPIGLEPMICQILALPAGKVMAHFIPT